MELGKRRRELSWTDTHTHTHVYKYIHIDGLPSKDKLFSILVSFHSDSNWPNVLHSGIACWSSYDQFFVCVFSFSFLNGWRRKYSSWMTCYSDLTYLTRPISIVPLIIRKRGSELFHDIILSHSTKTVDFWQVLFSLVFLLPVTAHGITDIFKSISSMKKKHVSFLLPNLEMK